MTVEISVGLLAVLVFMAVLGAVGIIAFAWMMAGFTSHGLGGDPYIPMPMPPKPRVRVKAGGEPTNPLDGARLWGGS